MTLINDHNQLMHLIQSTISLRMGIKKKFCYIDIPTDYKEKFNLF